MKYFWFVTVLSCLIFSLTLCTKTKGTNKDLAFSDKALYDSCLKAPSTYYLNNSNTFFSGSNGPHGTFKLRFNKLANLYLTDNGKLPIGSAMPEGAFIVKDVYVNNKITTYAMMYKKSNSWLWAEYNANGQSIYSANKTQDLCINCHNQSGNRDLILSFKYY